MTTDRPEGMMIAAADETETLEIETQETGETSGIGTTQGVTTDQAQGETTRAESLGSQNKNLAGLATPPACQ